MEEINWEELKKKNGNYHDVISDYESSLKRISLLKDLRDHEGMKILIKNFENMIQYIDNKLCNDRFVSDSERSELFIKKDHAKFLIELFSGLEEDEANVLTDVNNLQEGK